MSDRKPNVIAIVSYFPKPEDRGDPVRVAAMLRALAKSSNLTVLAMQRDNTSPEEEASLRAELFPATLETFPLPRRSRMGRSLLSLLLRTPPWILNRWSRHQWSRIRELSRGADLLVALGEAAGCSLALPGLANLRAWHWDKANVIGASAALDVSEERRLARRLRRRAILVVSKSYEGRLVKRASSVSVTSGEEAKRLHRLYGREADFVIPSGVTLPLRATRGSDDCSVVWLGSLAYSSNVAGLHRFIDEGGLAALTQAGLSLRVIGSGAPESLAKYLAGTEGIHYQGYLEDLSVVLGEARYGVVPLWSGAGVKLKTLTLLSYGLVVASTPVGVEGLPETETIALIDSTPVGLAHQLILAKTGLHNAIGERARECIERSFTPEASVGRIKLVVERWGSA